MRVITILCGVLMLAALLIPTAQANHREEYVWDNVWETIQNPTQPQLGFLKNDCWRTAEDDCGTGCAPDWLEWIFGPIHC